MNEVKYENAKLMLEDGKYVLVPDFEWYKAKKDFILQDVVVTYFDDTVRVRGLMHQFRMIFGDFNPRLKTFYFPRDRQKWFHFRDNCPYNLRDSDFKWELPRWYHILFRKLFKKEPYRKYRKLSMKEGWYQMRFLKPFEISIPKAAFVKISKRVERVKK